MDGEKSSIFDASEVLQDSALIGRNKKIVTDGSKELLDLTFELQVSKNDLRQADEKCANLEKALLHSQGVARQRLGEIAKLNEKLIYQESECSKKQAKLTLWVSNLSATIEHGESKRSLMKDEIIRLHEALEQKECEIRRLEAKIDEVELSSSIAMQATREGFERSLQIAENKLIHKLTEMNEHDEKYKELCRVTDLKRAEIDNLEVKCEELKVRLDAEKLTNCELMQGVSSMKHKLCDVSEKLKASEKEVRTSRNMFEKHERLHNAALHTHRIIKSTALEIAKEISQSQREAWKLKYALDSMSRDNQELKAALYETSSDAHEYSRVIDFQQRRINSLELSLQALASSRAIERGCTRSALAALQDTKRESVQAEQDMLQYTLQLEKDYQVWFVRATSVCNVQRDMH